jgi:ABC-type antimicrobial peptide transport system permease subunit
MALGAQPSAVIRLVLIRVTALVGTGVLVGAGISLLASGFVASLLYGLPARDPVILAGAALALGSVAALASWLPTYRAARFDPVETLRNN